MRIFKLLCLSSLFLLNACSTIQETKTPEALTPQTDTQIFSEQSEVPAHAAMLLPLSGKYAELGESFRNAGTLAQFDMAGNNFELSFYDTQGTEEGVLQAYRQALMRSPQIILGPITSQEVKALKEEEPSVPVITFTSDETTVGDNIYTTALLISEQVKQIIDYSCSLGNRHLALLGPNDTMGEIAVKSAYEALERCPGMEITEKTLYAPNTVNFSPVLLKFIPKPVDTRKKVLTPEEQLQLATPIQEQINFDSILIFERGPKLQQLVSLLSFYDITPDVVTFLGLISFGDIADKSFTGSYFAGLPSKDYVHFEQKYRDTFAKSPQRLSSLAYDAVSLASALTKQGIVSKKTLTNPTGFLGTDGLFRLKKNGKNERSLEIFKVIGKGHFKTVRSGETVFSRPQKDTFVFEGITDSSIKEEIPEHSEDMTFEQESVLENENMPEQETNEKIHHFNSYENLFSEE